MAAIPSDVAWKLCLEIREGEANRLFTQCWGCVKFSQNNEKNLCYNSERDLRGCGLVNRLYDARYAAPLGARAAV